MQNSIMKPELQAQEKWVNGRPMLANGNVWCPMCDEYHQNNSYCQQPNYMECENYGW